MKRVDVADIVALLFALAVICAVGVTTFREWRACRAVGGALVQVVDWPPVACIERKGAR